MKRSLLASCLLARYAYNRAVRTISFSRVNCRDYYFKSRVNRVFSHIGLSAMSCAKTAEPIEMQFGMLSYEGPGNMYYMGM